MPTRKTGYLVDNARLAGPVVSKDPPRRAAVFKEAMRLLLDDSIRFVEHAVAAGVDAHVDVGKWMVHGFVGAVGQPQAATESLNRIGRFLPG